jgi:hypothetical protein
MPTECSAEVFDFGTVEGRSVEAAFDGGLVTSDAGALLLGATDRAINLMDRFSSSDNPAMQQLEQAQQEPTDEVNPGASDQGTMRQCIRQCMRGDDMTGQPAARHFMRQRGMAGPFAMRIIFALMDRDGDGTVSLEEFQAAHATIFKAMNADKDGTVSMDEMQDFFQGAHKAGLPQRSAPRD